MNKKKIFSNILGLGIYLIVDFLISGEYIFFNSLGRGLMFLVIFNLLEWIVKRGRK